MESDPMVVVVCVCVHTGNSNLIHTMTRLKSIFFADARANNSLLRQSNCLDTQVNKRAEQSARKKTRGATQIPDREKEKLPTF